jgi:uncharacterized repeat protein (TIGR04076 family)
MLSKLKKLIIRVEKIKGVCPVYKIGDAFFVEEGYKLTTNKPICLHSLVSLLPYYVALSHGVSPSTLGIAGEDGVAYVQCLDPCKYTGGGTVIFSIKLEDK